MNAQYFDLKTNPNLTILAIGYKEYSKLWPFLFAKFREYYGLDYPTNFVFVSDGEDKLIDGMDVAPFTCYFTGSKGCFEERLLEGLSHVKTKWTLLVLEDYFPACELSIQKLEEMITFLEKNNGQFLQLGLNVPHYVDPKGKKVNSQGMKLKTHRRYKVSTQQAIWRTEQLTKLCSIKSKTPAGWEITLNKEENRELIKDIPSYYLRFAPPVFVNLINKGKIDRACLKLTGLKYQDLESYFPLQKRLENFYYRFKLFVSKLLGRY